MSPAPGRFCRADLVGIDQVTVENDLIVSANEEHVPNLYDEKPYKERITSALQQEGAEMYCLRCRRVVGVRFENRIHFFRHRVSEVLHFAGSSILN